MATAAPAASGQKLTPQQLNILQRKAVLQAAIEMTQQLPSQSIVTVSSTNNQLNFGLRPVGLLKKLIIEIAGTSTSGAGTATATNFGLANLLTQVTLTDLNNNIRVQTNGFHLTVLKQVKNREVSLSSMPISTIQTDAMLAGQFISSGSSPNFPVIVYPLPTTGGSAFRAVFELPVAYSDDDLRGAIYLNVVNSTATLGLTINPNPWSGTSAADVTGNVWNSGANAQGSVTNLTATVYQVYLDQIPVQNNAPILPVLDLATIYELKFTTLTGQAVSQDFPYPYANFRDFISTLVVWNSTGATAGLKNGSDVNTWALQAANFSNFWKIDPLLAAQKTREIIGTDLTLGTYYFSHRKNIFRRFSMAISKLC